MGPTDAQRIEHILEAIETIEERVADLDESAFIANDVVHDAVLYQLALLGEAANSLSSEVQERHPGIPWQQIVAFRNRIMHEYHSVEGGGASRRGPQEPRPSPEVRAFSCSVIA